VKPWKCKTGKLVEEGNDGIKKYGRSVGLPAGLSAGLQGGVERKGLEGFGSSRGLYGILHTSYPYPMIPRIRVG
jgi:hypothetical protein